MTQQEFDIQMARLKETWPHSNNWAPEKMKLIWTAVHQRSVLWLEKVVTNMLTTNKAAPTPAQFIELEKIESRKRLPDPMQAYFEKPHPKENSIFSDQERSEMFKVMNAAATGKISSKEAKQYARMIYDILIERGIPMDYRMNTEGEIIFPKDT